MSHIMSLLVLQMCYQIYTFMDAQRETAVLHNIDTIQVASATAAANAEKIQFNAAARSDVAAAHENRANRIRVRLGLGNGKMHGADGDHFHRHAAGHEGEDPYEQDDNVNTDQFIPHHSAQRDSYEDSHKKENFATTLRHNVATLVNSPQRKKPSNQGTGSPASPGRESPEQRAQTAGGSPHTRGVDDAHTPLHSSRRKVIEARDRVPVNILAADRFNATHDSGIGSKGPIMKHPLGNEDRTIGAITNWVKLLRVGAVKSDHTGANAKYDKTHGWHTNQEWDHQGALPHWRPTSATVHRLRDHKALKRPHSAQGRQRVPWDTATTGQSDASLQAHIHAGNDSQATSGVGKLPISDAGAVLDPTTTRGIEAERLQVAIKKQSRRPHSAGAVPAAGSMARYLRKLARKNGVSREDSIAALEMELASKMLELTTHLAEHSQPAAGGNSVPGGSTSTAGRAVSQAPQYTLPSGIYEEGSLSDVYAYSSLPFMVSCCAVLKLCVFS
jgi:hypothetical protein